jgi:V/A-type H+-transporting ATPase subunit F
MKAMAIGGRSFVSGFRLAGISGTEVRTPKEALNEILNLIKNKEISFILISEDMAKPVHHQITEIRSKQPIPLIYEIPAPGSKKEKIEYQSIIKSILKM